jgi:hypothetical protein
VPYEAVFFTKRTEGRSVHDMYDDGTFRATVELRTGPYAAIGFTPMSTRSAKVSAPVCLPGDPNCDPGVLGQILNYVSGYRPADCILFALAHVRPGRLRGWAAAVAEGGTRDDVQVAIAHLHGIRGANVLLEIVAKDRSAAGEVLLDLLDREDVRDFQVMHALGDDSRGFGELDEASLS